MKRLFVLSSIALSTLVFAGNAVEEAVRNVEIERNAKCTHVSTSRFSKCFGSPKTCFYNVKYSCLTAEGTFKLKVKVKETYSLGNDEAITTVRGTVISK